MSRNHCLVRYLTSLAVLFLCSCLPFFVYAKAIDDFPQISKLPVIRIGITTAPGNGHQSASASVVTRLRKMGYTGKIQVVYDIQSKHKLGYLLPPFDPSGAGHQIYDSQNIEFMDSDYFNNCKEIHCSEVKFAIIGADDFYTSHYDMRSEFLLTLQPYNWVEGSRITYSAADYEVYRFPLHALERLNHKFDHMAIDDIESFIKEEMSNLPELASKTDGLLHILSGSEKSELAFIYGHLVKRGQALRYAAGILRAFQKAPHMFKGNAILPIINSLSDEEKVKLQRSIHQSSLASTVDYIEVTDPRLGEKIKQLKPGHLLMVYVGPVTKSVFEYLFQSSTIAPLVEGRNSIGLMSSLGLPYLPSSVIENYQTAFVPQIAKDAVFAVSLTSRELDSNIAEYGPKIADFFIEARHENSLLRNFFKRQKNKRLKDDKLYAGLEWAEQILAAEHSSGFKKFLRSIYLQTINIAAFAKNYCQSALSPKHSK